MKTKFCLIVAFILTFSINSLAQIQIVPNKVTYKRVGKDVPEYKKTFDVIYPVVLGLEDYEVGTNLIKTLSYWNNFEESLEENLGSYYWLDEASYEVNYNKNSILDIRLSMDGSGAYPSLNSKNMVIDIKTGKQVFIEDVFTNIKPLFIKLDKAKKANEQKEIAERKKESPEDAAALKEMLEENKYPVDSLKEFSVSDKGVTFKFDYGFPHVIQALAPDGDYFFTWSELKPFIKPVGLLGQFVR